jgi:hypothetical protein
VKSYTKTYYTAFGYSLTDFVSCELCGATAVDISHIHAKGRRPDLKDEICNLMAMCRSCHLETGDKKADRKWLFRRHEQVMWLHGVKYDKDLMNDLINRS